MRSLILTAALSLFVLASCASATVTFTPMPQPSDYLPQPSDYAPPPLPGPPSIPGPFGH